jgi:CheY-like chemotaxis protein
MGLSNRDMDRQPHHLTSASSKGSGQEHRGAVRYTYRARMQCKVYHPGGSAISRTVMARDLSASGLSFLSDGFLHKSTRCQFTITTLDGSWIEVEGAVVRCRYVSNHIHEIGVALAQPIDVSRMLRDEFSASVLLVDDSADFANLISHMLVKRGMEVLIASDGKQALDAATGTDFDVIVMDVNLPGTRGPEVIRELRNRGACPVIIAMSADSSGKTRTECQMSGANRFLCKPFRPQALADAIKSELSNGVIYSDLSDDPEMDRFIAAFVASLPKRLESLHTAQRAHDLQGLLNLVRELKTITSPDGGCGYPALAKMAASLEESMTGGGTDWGGIERRVGEITDLAARVRIRNGK